MNEILNDHRLAIALVDAARMELDAARGVIRKLADVTPLSGRSMKSALKSLTVLRRRLEISYQREMWHAEVAAIAAVSKQNGGDNHA